MTDSFMEALGRQLQKLNQQVEQSIRTTEGIIDPDGAPATEFSVTPEQVLSVIQNNSEWMQQFEQNLERRFADLGARIVERWQRDTHRQLQQSISELTRLLAAATQESISSRNSRGQIQAELSRELARGRRYL